MYRLILTLWYICVLRFGPQSLPQTRNTLGWVVGLHLAIGTAYNLPFTTLLDALHMELSTLLVTFAFARLALLLGHRNERYLKTVTALLGSDVIISAVGLLLVGVLLLGLGLEELWNSASLLVVIWSFVVTAHIFRHVFESGLAVGVIVAFLFFFTGLMFVVLVQVGLASG